MRLAVAALAVAGCQGSPAIDARPGKVELIDAPVADDLLPVIAGEVARATADGKQLLVYVGASWCEPCQQFHAAAAAGDLDAAFPRLRLLVFDDDLARDALGLAGYDSELIPLFAEPLADGHPSGRRIEGSVKEGAVTEITPRLRTLLAPPATGSTP
jgi:hypothetical protein